MSVMAWGDLWFLIVDDNPQFRRFVRSLLSAFGVNNVLEAADPEEATDLLRVHHVDIAIVDHMLGADRGLAWIRWLSHDPESPRRGLPIILVSGHNGDHLARAALRAGATSFIRKPFGARDLWMRVAHILNTDMIQGEDATPETAGPDTRAVRSGSGSGSH